MLGACVLALILGVVMQGLSLKQGLDAFIDGFNISMFPQGSEGIIADVPRLLNRGGMFSMMSTILLVFCAFSFAGALTLTGALNIIINRLLTVIHSVGQLIAATIGTTILVTGATSDGKLALLVPAELFKDAYRRMGLDTKNLSRTIEDAGTVIEPLLPPTSAGVYMATTLGVSTTDLLLGGSVLCRHLLCLIFRLYRNRYRENLPSRRKCNEYAGHRTGREARWTLIK